MKKTKYELSAEYCRWQEIHRLRPLQRRYVIEKYGVDNGGKSLLERAERSLDELRRQERILAEPAAGEVVVTYIVFSEMLGLYKIGKTTNLEKRIASLQTAIPADLRVVHAIYRDKSLEQQLHGSYQHRHTSREWFALTEDDVHEIQQIPSRLPIGEHEAAKTRARELRAAFDNVAAAGILFHASEMAACDPSTPGYEESFQASFLGVVRRAAESGLVRSADTFGVEERFYTWAAAQPDVQRHYEPFPFEPRGNLWFTDREALDRLAEVDATGSGSLLNPVFWWKTFKLYGPGR